MSIGPEDDVLVLRAKNGDQASLCELIHRYERRTYNLAYRLMGNHADASDAAQESLVRVYTRLDHFRGDSAFSTWLFRVVTNTCLDEIRRRGRSRCASLDTPPQAEDGVFSHGAVDPETPSERAERHEVQDAVQRAVGRLPAEYRTVIVLRDLQDYSYQEIARMLGASLGTVKSRLHRARRALRDVLRSTEGDRLGLGRSA